MDAGFFPIAFYTRWAPTGYQLPFASSVISRVYSETQRGIPCFPGAVDYIVNPDLVSADVNLEDFGVICTGCNFFQCRFRDRADKIYGAEFLRCLCDGNSTLRRYRLQRADRGQKAGDAEFMS